MSTLNQIVTVIAERVGRQYDLIFKRELKTIVNYWRGAILRQALKDNPRDASYFKSSWTMPVQKDFIVKCPFNYGCVMRTVDIVPKTLRGGNFDFVGSPNLEKSYDPMYISQVQYLKSRRNIKKDLIYYTQIDGYLYFYGMKESQKYVGIQDIVTDLDLVSKYKKCNSDDPCYSDDLSYPLSEDLIQRVIQAILSTELRNQIIPEETEVKVNGK